MPKRPPSSAVVECSIAISGGHLGKNQWSPVFESMEVVDGRSFAKFDRSDRVFARFLGLDMGGRCPWASNQWPVYLVKKRNEAITAALKSADGGHADPLRDEGAAPAKKPKCMLIDLVPRIIDVVLPEIDVGGVVLPQCMMSVMKTSDFKTCVPYEVTPGFLDYLVKAVHVASPTDVSTLSVVTKGGRIFQDAPDVSWVPSRGHVKCTYMDKDGHLHSHTKAAPQCSDADLTLKFITQVATDVQAFFNENHYGDKVDADVVEPPATDEA